MYLEKINLNFKEKGRSVVKAFFKIFLIAVIVMSILMSLGIICATIYLDRYSDSRVDNSLLKISHSYGQTTFYYYEFTDREGRIGQAKQISNAKIDSGIKYKYVSYNEIPQDLINAFISIEDKRFYNHEGVDLLRSSKAVINFVCKGSKSFGGSTITQQLVKNLTGNSELTAQRKIKEAFSAINLEKDYDKSEILEMYMNIINLSQGCRGIGAASEYFFSKSPRELTLAESATIAAITNNPSKYDPLRHPENNKLRRDTVLRCMLDNKYITQDEYNKAINTEIELNISDKYNDNNVNSWYIDMVIEDVISDLCDKYDISRETASLRLYRGGYKIYTAMDNEIQALLDKYYSNTVNFPADSQGNMPQSSMIIMDPYTGDILGVAGAIGKKQGNRIQNYATNTKRPPGSTIKPISVYAPALEKGIINWSTIVNDSPVKVASGDSDPWPLNASRTYVGDVTVKYAVENSLNTIAVKILNMLGKDESFDFLKNKLNIESLDSQIDNGEASLALGQCSYGVNLRELVAAYSIFEEGIISKPRSYFKVTDSDGKIILDNAPDQEKVMSRENAAIMTKLLQTVVETGTAKNLISLDSVVEVAGKTGTSHNNCDRYFIGYTPSLLAGVWFGYDYPKNLDCFGGNFAAVFWDEVMNEIYKNTGFGKNNLLFKIPDSVQKLSYNKKTGEIPTANDDPTEIEEGWFCADQTHIFK